MSAEIIATVGGAAAGALSTEVFRWLMRRRSQRSPSGALISTNQQLIEQLEAANGDLRKQLQAHSDAILQLHRSNQEIASLEQTVSSLTERNTSLTSELQQARTDLGRLSEWKELTEQERETVRLREVRANNLIRRALGLEGKLWTQPPMDRTPEFRDLAQRKTPIVAILNLKGGVGKTTTTAWLARALVDLGLKVLLVDFDLQGSLSSLFHSDSELKRLDGDRKLLRHFLAGCRSSRDAKLDDYLQPIFANGSRLVATTDNLAYAEMSLTFRWLLRVGRHENDAEGGPQQWNGSHDVRFIMRKALHRKGLTKKFDVILLDCPPLVNLCCVNALAASDFVIVPVLPSRKAVERVPPLLRRIAEIRGAIHPHLKVMGLLATRTERDNDYTKGEKDFWAALQAVIPNPQVWGEPIEMFDTFIPDRAYIRAREENFLRPAAKAEEERVDGIFEQLAREIVSLVPETRPSARLAAVGAGKEGTS